MSIGHIAIWAKDLEKLRVFYTSYFNGNSGKMYENKEKHFRSYFIYFEKGCGLELMNRSNISEGADKGDFFGFAHIAFSVGSKEAVDTLTERMQKDGYKIISYPRTTGDGYYESVVNDPERNTVEITV
jgi:lactoylglutathione lyase